MPAEGLGISHTPLCWLHLCNSTTYFSESIMINPQSSVDFALHLHCLLIIWHVSLQIRTKSGHREPEIYMAMIPQQDCNTLPVTCRDSSSGTPTFGGGAQGSLLRDGSLPKDGSLYKDGSITSCLQAAFQAQLEEEDQQRQVPCHVHCCTMDNVLELLTCTWQR